MSYHVPYDHACTACGADYIPYAADVACPRCGARSAETFDFIPEAVASLRYNLADGGRYHPGAWSITSLGDQVLYLLFLVFDAYEHENSGAPFPPFAARYLAKVGWEDQPHLRDHVAAIAVRVWEELEGSSP